MSNRKRFSKRPPDGVFGANASWIHGGCGTTEYITYAGAKSRCQNPKNPQWPHYGGRGIEFRIPSFVVFLEHLGRRPRGKILGRINDGHFEIGNVRWITRHQSAKNRRPHRNAPRATTCGHAKHHAKGLCRACYESTPTIRARKAAWKTAHRVPRPRKIAVNSCGHPDRPHYAFGLCVVCYRISPEGRAVRRRYENSTKGRQTRARYASTPKSRAYQTAYAKAHYVPKPPRARVSSEVGSGGGAGS